MKRLSTLQYISDIHLEYSIKFPKIPIKGSTLALLGDIGNPFKDNYKEFLQYTSHNWDSVLLLTGNHEYWQEKYNMSDVDNKIRDIVTNFPNITFLNNDKYEFSNYTILGTTLWTSMSRVISNSKKMGDDLYIPKTDIISNHNNSIKWLESQIHSFVKNKNLEKHSQILDNKKIIVFSHHLPSYN